MKRCRSAAILNQPHQIVVTAALESCATTQRIRAAKLALALAFCCSLPLPLTATENLPRIPFAESARLPEPNQFVVTPWYAYSVFRKIWIGHTETSIEIKPQEDFELNDGMIRFDYGLSKQIAFDATIGYVSAATRVWVSNNRPVTTQGLMDTQIGVRYRLLDERDDEHGYVPTLTARLGGVLPGTYSPDFPMAPGNGAFAFEPSLMMTKTFTNSGFGLYAEFGYRLANRHVPQALFGTGGLAQSMKMDWFMNSLDSLTVYAGYRGLNELSGTNFTGPGRVPGSPFDFVEVGYSRTAQEIYHLGELGLAMTDKSGRRYFFSCSHPFAGRNTAKSNNFILGMDWPLNLR